MGLIILLGCCLLIVLMSFFDDLCKGEDLDEASELG